jgi:hypothetical protein
MTDQEKQLIDAIKAKPNHQVFVNIANRRAVVVKNKPNGATQYSVWLGRTLATETLQNILSAA